MKGNPQNKFQVARTGRDILDLFKSKEKLSENLNRLAPANETETELLSIWAGVLGHENFGVNDDFFQIGGNSLKGIQLISRISRQFMTDIQLTDIFLLPTIAELAGFITSNQNDKFVSPRIKVQARPERIPLSFSQERLWFIDRLEGSIQYHLPAVLTLKGKLNGRALEYALQSVVNRHEPLRTVFSHDNEQTWQTIMDKDGWNLTLIDGSMYGNNRKGLQGKIDSLIKEPFDLSKDHMIRASLITLNEMEHVLVITTHHIASDGWSTSVLVKEVIEFYESYVEGRAAELSVLEIQFADYTIWQRNYFQDEVSNQKIGYWKEKLQDVAPLDLPTDFVRPPIWSANGATTEFSLDKELTKELQLLSQQQGATLFMTLLAALKVLLHRYSGQQDICVGTAIAGRQQQEIEGLIGFFVNTLAIRSDVNSDATFTEFLQQVKTTTLDAYKHQEAPFEKVVDAVVTHRDLSRNPIFQVMFILQNTPDIPELQLGEVALTRDPYKHTTALFDLSVSMSETALGMQGMIEYCTDIYNGQTIELIIKHYKQLLGSIVNAPKQSMGMLPMLSEADKDQLIFDFNSTYSEYPDKSIVALFEEQTRRTPEAVAVVFDGKQLTYEKLNEQANQLAHYLRNKGIKDETLIPICIERSVEMLVGIFGILKTGAAYVPIDPEYPQERISQVLEDTGALLVLSSKESQTRLKTNRQIEVVALDTDWPTINQQPLQNPTNEVNPDQLAYVIYTSGSTGKPKGVMVEHRSVVNLLLSIANAVNFNSSGSILAVTTFSFDICYLEFFMPLIFGGKVIILSRSIAVDGFRLAESISFYRPTHMQATPSTWQLLLNANWQNSEDIKMLIGGEAIKEDIKEELTTRGSLWNVYGPTETTIWSSIKQLHSGQKVLIGTPIANTDIYILNKNQQLCPVAVAGEICIGGVGLARGYWNRAELTAEKFITNPFSKDGKSRVYRTGDLGRWLADGNIECLGRLDDQVKIRGYRVELGEIETVLGQCEVVNEGVVVARDTLENNKRLVGYIIPEWQSVKTKERELYQRQVESWKEIYENEYDKTEENESLDPEFDISIWKNSFSGEPIGAEQMKDWLHDIVQIILSEEPEHVLEIGCGSGLIYYQLAGKIKKYTGTDITHSSINQINHRINKGLRNYGPTELQVCAAHEITLIKSEQVDTIILNSVIQYFPGEDYLTDVIKKSISLLNGSGRIIIGDVRDNRLLKLFKSRLLIGKLQDTINVKEFMWEVHQDVLKEEELCFSPEYFYNLQSLFPQITHIEIQWKHSSFINELTLYRYNVIIHVGIQKKVLELNWQTWNEKENEHLHDQLQQGSALIALRDVPNPRLWKERLLDQTLNRHSASTVGDLAVAMLQEDKESIPVEQFLRVAVAKGYHYRFFLDNDPLKVNIVLELHSSGNFIKHVYGDTPHSNRVLYTNIPLFNDISSLLQKDIRSLLQQRLPEYMVPSELVMLGYLPLTNNGKVDRKFLSERVDERLGNRITYEAPRTGMEQTLATIWQELLNVDCIGRNDDFFELGGHSLLAMRMISTIEKELLLSIPLQAIFKFTSISELSKYLAIQEDEESQKKESTAFQLLDI